MLYFLLSLNPAFWGNFYLLFFQLPSWIKTLEYFFSVVNLHLQILCLHLLINFPCSIPILFQEFSSDFFFFFYNIDCPFVYLYGHYSEMFTFLFMRFDCQVFVLLICYLIRVLFYQSFCRWSTLFLEFLNFHFFVKTLPLLTYVVLDYSYGIADS